MKISQCISARFVWGLGWFLLAFAGWGTSVAFAQITFTLPGQTETTRESDVYGKPECETNQRIKFTWRVTPTAQFDPTRKLEFKLILGSENDQDGVLIAAGEEIPPTNTNTNTIDFSRDFSGDTPNERATKGTLADNMFTVRDIIGYYKTTQGETIDPKDTAAACKLNTPAEGGAIPVRLFLVLKYYVMETNAAGVPTSTLREETEGFDLRYDLTPPTAPTNVQITPSDGSLRVTWDSPDNNATFELYYHTQSFDKADPTKGGAQKVACTSAQATTCNIGGLQNDTKYFLSVRAIDEANNPGEFSEVVEGSPIDLTDFYEGYRKAGGADQGFGGGFCFIATAAYGTYDHRYVQILRDFRDRYLLPTSAGQAFVAWYYRTSPPWADWLREHPVARRVTQALLLPLIAVSAFFVRTPTWFRWFVGLLLLLVWLRRRIRMKSLASTAIIVALFFSLPLATSEAASPRNFGLEVRVGPYTPQIDSESGLQGTPYKDFFGGPQLYLELGFEWLFFQSPKYGTLGVGGSLGFSWATSQAKQATTAQPLLGVLRLPQTVSPNQTTDTTDTDKTTGLWIVPLRVDLAYRFDRFVHSHNFPLVPYARLGLDYFVWFITEPNGGLATSGTGESETTALGGRFGFHVSVGVQFLLDFLDPSSGQTFDVEFGVNHSYLFAEWNMSWVGLLSPGLNLSDSSLRAGLMFQF